MRASRAFAVLASISLAACATTRDGDSNALTAFGGNWTVDLRPSLDDPSYSQPMVLNIDADGNIEGSFYGSAILSGRAGSGQDRRCIAFRTSDNSGAYQHSGCLEGEVIVGQTWSEGRNFVLPWTATRTISGD